MTGLIDLLRRKQKEPDVPAVKPSEPVPISLNLLEQAVNDTPPVAAQLLNAEDQLREDALQTMAYLEAAREEKGNFCITLGSGDRRAVLLVAPVEGVKAEDLVKGSPPSGIPDYIHRVTRTDYILLTAGGPPSNKFYTG